MKETFEKWIERIDVTSDVMEAVGQSYNGAKKVPKEQYVFLDLLKRIKANLRGCRDMLFELSLLDPNRDNFEKKIPLSILMRSCIADCLTGLYLASFDREGFAEELDVLNLDFVKYLGSMIPLEIELYNTLFEDREDAQRHLDERHEGFSKWLQSDIGEAWKTKKPVDFRSDKTRTNKIDFLGIHQRLKEAAPELRTFSYMYNFYRYYSQYEHFTSAGRELYNSPFEKEIGLMERALASIMHSVLLLFSTLDKASSEMVKPLIDELNAIVPPKI